MIKALPTLGVVGVFTGRILKEHGFGEIHEVLDHLYPGIMTIGCAAMAEPAKKYVAVSVPALAELPQCTRENYREVAAAALEKFGQTIEIDGPLHVSEAEIAEQFDALGKRIERQP